MAKRKYSRRADRVKACELAVAAFGGHFMTGEVPAAKLVSLCIFFETYIAEGANHTVNTMGLLERPTKEKGLKVIAGGRL